MGYENGIGFWNLEIKIDLNLKFGILNGFGSRRLRSKIRNLDLKSEIQNEVEFWNPKWNWI